MIQRLPEPEYEDWSTDDLKPGDFIQVSTDMDFLLFVVRKASLKEYLAAKQISIAPVISKNYFFIIPIAGGKFCEGEIYALSKFLKKGYTRIPCSV